MAGALLQLVAYGAQDLYITGSPQTTFFKTVYRRYTNFALEPIEVPFENSAAFGKRISITIPRFGDMYNRLWIRVTVNAVKPSIGSLFAWVKLLGLALIESVEMEVGGMIVDKQYDVWLRSWIALSRRNKQNRGIAIILGATPEMADYNNKEKPEYTMYIPLPFFQQPVPLIALQYHEIKMNFKLTPARKLVIANSNFILHDTDQISIKDASMLIQYVYLDSDERRRFAQRSYETIINQVQYTGPVSLFGKFNNIKLNYNHPTKSIYFMYVNGNYVSNKRFLFYTPVFWRRDLPLAAEKIIRESSKLGKKPEIQYNNFLPNEKGYTLNKKIYVVNKSQKVFIINTDSLLIQGYKLTDKIVADIVIEPNENITIHIKKPGITVRDLSFPVESMIDTRFTKDDPFITQFDNFGLLIDGTGNPVTKAKLIFNGQDRFEYREGRYFNYVQPYQHYSNIPVESLNVYSFALTPEPLSPSGTCNMSRIDDARLNFILDDVTQRDKLPELDIFSPGTKMEIYGNSYNVGRLMSGMFGLAFVN